MGIGCSTKGLFYKSSGIISEMVDRKQIRKTEKLIRKALRDFYRDQKK